MSCQRCCVQPCRCFVPVPTPFPVPVPFDHGHRRRGHTGATGPQGNNGPQGFPGATGATGPSGSPLTGFGAGVGIGNTLVTTSSPANITLSTFNSSPNSGISANTGFGIITFSNSGQYVVTVSGLASGIPTTVVNFTAQSNTGSSIVPSNGQFTIPLGGSGSYQLTFLVNAPSGGNFFVSASSATGAVLTTPIITAQRFT